MSTKYEVGLGPAAERFILDLRDPAERKELADALREELIDGPNEDKEIRFDGDGGSRIHDLRAPEGAVYTATPLSFNGYVAVHRPMIKDELRRLKREQHRTRIRTGVIVLDILPLESAWATFPRLF